MVDNGKLKLGFGSWWGGIFQVNMKSISKAAQNPPGTHLAGGNGRPAEGGFTYKPASSPYWFQFFSDGRTPLYGVRLSPLPSPCPSFSILILTCHMEHIGQDAPRARGRVQGARRAREELLGALPRRLRARDHVRHALGVEHPRVARQHLRSRGPEPLPRPGEQARRDRVPLREEGRGWGAVVPRHQLRRLLEWGAEARQLILLVGVASNAAGVGVRITMRYAMTMTTTHFGLGLLVNL